MKTKKCNKCNEIKVIIDFHKHKQTKDGHRNECKTCRIIETKLNYEKNKNRYNEQSKNWNKNNPEKRKLILKKHENNPLIKLKSRVRHRIRQFLKTKNITKKNKTFQIVGLTPKELKVYLENKFEYGMTWENYGIWHIDHIIPLSSVSEESKIYDLCYYTNLQPMWGNENLSKGKKIL